MAPTFEFTVDEEHFTTSEHILTPVQILQIAGRDPNTHYLVQIEGTHQKSYEKSPEEPIHMHEHMKFISIPTGPTTVS